MKETLPETFLREMKELFGTDYEAYLASFERPARPSLRVNTLKISVEDFQKIAPFSLERIPWTADGFYYEEKDRPSLHPYYYAGLYYLQEASAMVPAETLEIEEGDVVLDACAAPGGKSTKLLSKLHQTGVLFANDISVSRARILLRNIEHTGAENAFVLAEDLGDLDRDFHGSFDKILVDAPCSGEGMFRKERGLIRSYEEKGSEEYVPLQKEILMKALGLLRDGGKLVYSTCTFSVSENEDVIRYALDHCPDARLLEVPKYDGFLNGIGLPSCARLYPHKLEGEGHFTAYLQKGEGKRPKRSRHAVEVPEVLAGITHPFADGRFEKRDDRLYFVPDHPAMGKHRILRSGLLIGEYRKERLEFAPSFALALRKEEYPYVLDLPSSDERVLRYLKGETISVKDTDLPEKTVLVCVDSFPLGFGKKQGTQLKNLYPKEWRMR